MEKERVFNPETGGFEDRPVKKSKPKTVKKPEPGPVMMSKPTKPKPEIPKNYVVVTDIDIKFGSMVGLMIKFAFASIPAAIAIYFIMTVLGGMIVSLLGK